MLEIPPGNVVFDGSPEHSQQLCAYLIWKLGGNCRVTQDDVDLLCVEFADRGEPIVIGVRDGEALVYQLIGRDEVRKQFAHLNPYN